MAIELARARALIKPWGVSGPSPWHRWNKAIPIGEIWYERPGHPLLQPSLLLKLLFTSQPLSIQVHPDDAYAHSIGLANGKTEAWYVLSAVAGAKVALGLNQQTTLQQLRTAVDDGSIGELVVWQDVSANDVIFVPAGTIHAIGAGLVIAEIQQRSDATYRLYDHGRRRALHIERAIAVANAGPADVQAQPERLSDERTLLVSNPHFVFERIELAPGATWCLQAECETWLLVLSGSALAASFDVAIGDTIFAQLDRVDIQAGKVGLVGLVAYAGLGGPAANLLQRLQQPVARDARGPQDVRPPPLRSRASVGMASERVEIRP
jgi:mannose-6-phosphate isomerase